jgi:hypothetical protein
VIDIHNNEVIASGMFKIAHNNDRTLTLNMSASMTVATGALTPNSTGAATFDINPIIPKSWINVDKSRLTLNETLTCSFSAYHSDVQHEVAYRVNG